MTVSTIHKRQVLSIIALIGAFLGGDVVGPVRAVLTPETASQADTLQASDLAELKLGLRVLETREEERYLALQDRLTRIEKRLDRDAD